MKKYFLILAMIVLIIPLSSPKAYNLCNNYVAWWGFNEGISNIAYDCSQNGNDGTILGGATWTNDSRYKYALEFDGVDDKILITKTPSVDLVNKVTLEAYIKRKSNADGMIISKNGPYFLAVRDNVIAGGVYANDGNNDTNTWTEVHGNIIIEQNKWYLLKMVYNGSNINVYVNGILDNSAPKIGQMPQVSQNVHIGWGEPGQNQYFKGIIDEIRISGQ